MISHQNISTMATFSERYIKPTWPAPSQIKAFTTTRCFGFSTSPFDYFNLAAHVNDHEDDVTKNRNLLIEDLNLLQKPLWIQQVHGIEAINLTCDMIETPTADACYTVEPNCVCAILTADCVPILLCNQSGSEVAAIHAGWRGLLNGVIENTIKHMKSSSSELLAWIGPAIGPGHFEISKNIYDHFFEKNQKFEKAFKCCSNRWFADLFMISRIILIECGLTSIDGGGICTYSDPKRFYSYRRDGENTGRMASLIWINQ